MRTSTGCVGSKRDGRRRFLAPRQHRLRPYSARERNVKLREDMPVQLLLNFFLQRVHLDFLIAKIMSGAPAVVNSRQQLSASAGHPWNQSHRLTRKDATWVVLRGRELAYFTCIDSW
jgi:hypothetical protein